MPIIKTSKKISSWGPLLILFAVAFAVYGRSLGFDFIFNWDDNQYVFGNRALLGGISPFALKLAFTTSYVGNYAPFQILSYMLDTLFWGMNPHGYHFTNLIIHGTNSFVFYVLLLRWSGNRLWALASALLFLVHPVQVESVVWISQRKNLLAMFFFLTAFAAWQKYRERPALPWYLLSLAVFLMAILSKSVAVVFPFVLIFYDYGILSPVRPWELLKDKIPLFLIAALGGGLTAYIQGGQPLYGGNLWNSFLTMSTVLARYLGMLLWPARLSAFYDPPVKTMVDSEVLACFALLVMLAGVGLLLWKRRSELLFWYLLFFLGLLPVSQIIPIVTLMNDRYLYFPMLGAAPLLFWPLRDVNRHSDVSRHILLLIAAMLLTVSAVSSWQRTSVWQNATTLWTDAVYKTPSAKIAWGNMIQAYAENENLAAIPGNLVEKPEFRGGMEVAIRQLLSQGDTYNASRIQEQLISAYPNFPEVWYLGGIIESRFDASRAEEMFRHSVEVDPEFPKAYFALGNIAFARRDYESAASFYAQSENHGGKAQVIAAYQAAVAAMTGRSDLSRQLLKRAFENGMKDCDIYESADEFKHFQNEGAFRFLVTECQQQE